MKKALKRGASILLTLLMLVSMLPALALPVFAAEPESGAPEDEVVQEPVPETEAPEEDAPEEDAPEEEPPVDVPDDATEEVSGALMEPVGAGAAEVEPGSEEEVAAAAAAADDTSIGKVDTGVLAEMNFNTDTTEVEALMDKDIAPYGTGITALDTISELFVGAGWRQTLYDGTPANQSHNNNKAAVFNYENLKAGDLVNGGQNAGVLDYSNSYSKTTSPGLLYSDNNVATGSGNTAARVLAGEYDFIRSVGFDPTNVGRNTHVAEVVAKVRSATETEMGIHVIDLENQTITPFYRLGGLPFRMFAGSAGAYLSIDAGDYDGDGREELAVFKPMNIDEPSAQRDSEIFIFKMETSSNITYSAIENGQVVKKTGSLPMPVVKNSISVKDVAAQYGMKFDGLKTSATGTTAMKEIPVVAMATSRQSEDLTGADDLIFTISYTRNINTRTTGTKLRTNGLTSGDATAANSDRQSIASRVLTWIDPLGPANEVKPVTGLQSGTSAFTWNWSEYGSATAAPMYEIGAFAGVGTGDIDNDKVDEVVVASYRQMNALNSDSGSYSTDEMLVTYLEYDYATKTYKLAQKPNWVNFGKSQWGNLIALSDGLYNGDVTEPYLTWTPPVVLGFAERGTGAADSVLVNGMVVALDSHAGFGSNGTTARPYKSYDGYPTGMGSATLTTLKEDDKADLFTARYAMPLARMDNTTDTGRVLAEAVAGNFDSNPGGREQVVVTYITKNSKSNDYRASIGMMGIVNPDDNVSFTVSNDTNAFFAGASYMDAGYKESASITIADVDIDADSLIIRYAAGREPDYYFSDPKPIILLQAAPYFEELGEHGSTYYESFDGHGNADNHEVSIGAGYSVGFEQESNIGVAKIGGIKVLAKANISAGYANESATETTTYTGFTTNKTDSIVLSMTPYIRYYYEFYDKEAGGQWTPMVLDYPMNTRVTSLDVDTYDAMAEAQGWQTIRGNAMLHTPGDPSTYPAAMAGWHGVGSGWTATGNASVNTATTSQDSSSHGVVWGAGVSTEMEVNLLGAVGGLSASVDYTGGYTWTNFSGFTYGGTVPGISAANNEYSFDWKFGWYKTKLVTEQPDNPVDVVVLGYLASNVRARPKPPANLHVKTASDNTVTLGWSKATGKVVPEYYTLQKLRSNTHFNVGAIGKHTSSQYTLTDNYAARNIDLEYAVTSSGYMNNQLVAGPRSNTVKVLTTDSSLLRFTTHPKDGTWRVGRTVSMTVEVENNTDIAGLTYNWQHYNETDGWKDVGTGNGLATLNLGSARLEMNNTVYRCVVTSVSGGQNVVAYSNSATVRVSKYAPNFHVQLSKGVVAAALTGRVGTSTSNGDPLNYSIWLNAAAPGPAPTGTVAVRFVNTSTNEGYTVKMPYAQTGTSGSSSYMDCVWYPTKPGDYQVNVEYYGDSYYSTASRTASQLYSAYARANASSLVISAASTNFNFGYDRNTRLSLYMRSMNSSGTTKASLVENSTNLTFSVIREGEDDANGTPVQQTGLVTPYTSTVFTFTPNKAGRYYITATYVLSGSTYTATCTVNVNHGTLEVRSRPVAASPLATVHAMSAAAFEEAYGRCTLSGMSYTDPLYNETVAAMAASLGTSKGSGDIEVGNYLVTPYLDLPASSPLMKKLNERYKIVYIPGTLTIDPDVPATATLTFGAAGVGGVVTAAVDDLPVTSGTKVPLGLATFTAVPDNGYDLIRWVGATQDKQNPLKATAQVAPDGSTEVQAMFSKGGIKSVVTGLTLEPGDSTVTRGQSLQFTADVSVMGGASEDITWELIGNKSDSTTLSESGLLKVSIDEYAETLTVRVVTKGAPVHVATATISLESPLGVNKIRFLPNMKNMQRGTSQQFAALVLGNGEFDKTATWGVSYQQSSGTRMTPDGLLTVAADESFERVRVYATADGYTESLGDIMLSDSAVGVNRFNIELYTEDLDYDRYYNSSYLFQPQTTPGTTVQFKTMVGHTDGYNVNNTTIKFAVRGANHAGTTIDANTGLLTISPEETAEMLQVVADWSYGNSVLSSSVYLALNHVRGSVAGVSVDPPTDELNPGDTATFTAEVEAADGAETTVTWEVLGAESESAGTIIDAATGELTVGEDETAERLLVVATSTQDVGKHGMAEVTITGNVHHKGVFGILVSPAAATVHKGESQAFTAEVIALEGVSQELKWELIGKNSSASGISAIGVLTVSETETAETLTVRATSVLDDTVQGDAIVTVAAARLLSGVSLYPAKVSLALQESRTLTLRPAAGDTLPDDADIHWEADGDAAILTPEGDGRSATLLGWANGTTTVTVTVTLPENDEEYTATSVVTVYTPIENFTLGIPDGLDRPLAPGEGVGLIPQIEPAGAASGVEGYLWSSSNSLVARVDKIGQVEALKPGTATITATTKDKAFTASYVVTVRWPQGTLAASPGSLLLKMDDGPFTLAVEATGELGAINHQVLMADGQTEFEEGAEVIEVRAITGGTYEVKAARAGTAYIHFSAEKNPNITAVCRVDVYEEPVPAEDGTVTYAKRHLQTTAATIYSRNLGRSITLPLRSDGNGAPWLMDGAEYTFTGNATIVGQLEAAYTIKPGADGQSLVLEPRETLTTLPAKKYTAGIAVKLPGASEAQALIAGSLALTVVDRLPKLAATAVSVNSFLDDLTRDIVITGAEDFDYELSGSTNAKKAAANKKLEDSWLDVDFTAGSESVTVAAGTSKRSGTYYLTVRLDKDVWDEDAVVEVPLKVNVTYTTPALKLASAKVTMHATVADNTGATLTLLPKAANATLQGMGVRGIDVIPYGELTDKEAKTYKEANQDAFKVTGFNRASGTFTLAPVPDAGNIDLPKGKVLLGVTVSGGGYAMRLPVTVSVVKPGSAIRLTANTTSVTLNQLLSPAQSTTFELDTNAKGYNVDWDSGVTWQLKRGKTDVTKLGELDVIPDGNSFIVTTTRRTKANTTYKLTVTKAALYQDTRNRPKDVGITLSVKTVKTTAKVSASLSVKEKVNLTTGAYAVLTAKLGNYLGGFTGTPTFDVTLPRGVEEIEGGYFEFRELDNTGTRWAIIPRNVAVTPGTYTVAVTGATGVLNANGGDGEVTTRAVKFTVTATRPKATLDAKKVTMYSTDQHGTVTVGLTLPAGTPPVTAVKIKSAAHNKMYDVVLRGDKLVLSFDQLDFSAGKPRNATLTLEVYLDGNAKAATTAKLGVAVKRFK